MEKRGARRLPWQWCLLLHWSKVLIGLSDARQGVTLKVKLLKMLWYERASSPCPVARSSCHYLVWSSSANIFPLLERRNTNALHLIILLITLNHQIWLFFSGLPSSSYTSTPPYPTIRECSHTPTPTPTKVRFSSPLGSRIISLRTQTRWISVGLAMSNFLYLPLTLFLSAVFHISLEYIHWTSLVLGVTALVLWYILQLCYQELFC